MEERKRSGGREKEAKFEARILLDYLDGQRPHSICGKYNICESTLYNLVSAHNSKDGTRKLERQIRRLEKKLKIAEEDNHILRDVLGKL